MTPKTSVCLPRRPLDQTPDPNGELDSLLSFGPPPHPRIRALGPVVRKWHRLACSASGTSCRRSRRIGALASVGRRPVSCALHLCPRSVMLNDDVITADRPREILADADLIADNRLELPFGYQLT